MPSLCATELVAMGLLPDLAHDLLPGLSAEAPDLAVARAGWSITAYALGAADRNLRRTVLVGVPVFLAATAFVGLFGDSPAGVVVGAFAVGGSHVLLIPAVQTR